MGLDGAEVFDAALDAVELAKAVKAAVDGLPPKGERTAVDYAKAFGAAPGTPLMLTAELIDQVEQDVKD